MKIKNQIAIGIVCMVLGIIIALQYKMFQDSFGDGKAPFQRQTELANELIDLKKEKDALQVELKEARDILDEIEGAASQDNAIIKNLTDTLREYEILAGMTDVVGEGVVVTIDLPPDESGNFSGVNILNEYLTILALINDLNASGAEAISINDQRLIATSEIRAAGDSLNVNFVPMRMPIVIRAIAKSSALEGAINYRFGYVVRLREAGLLVDVKEMDEVIIPRYQGIINFQYAETIEGN
jgi:uncharacterized protein YlxW (UPF0749 family)